MPGTTENCRGKITFCLNTQRKEIGLIGNPIEDLILHDVAQNENPICNIQNAITIEIKYRG